MGKGRERVKDDRETDRQRDREKRKTGKVLLAPDPFRRISGKRDWKWAELT